MSTANAQSAPTTDKKPDSSICLWSLKAGILFSAAVIALCFIAHHSDRAWGFLIGAALSLFSMATLMIAVPFLTWSGAPRRMSGLLTLTLFMKMPLFCFGLYLATHTQGVSAFACFVGICVAPAVITLYAVLTLVQEAAAARRFLTPAAVKAKTIQTPDRAKTAQTPARTAPARPVSPEFAPEQG